MRQPGLGKIEWVKEDAVKKQKEDEKFARAEAKESKSEKSKSKKGGKK